MVYEFMLRNFQGMEISSEHYHSDESVCLLQLLIFLSFRHLCISPNFPTPHDTNHALNIAKKIALDMEAMLFDSANKPKKEIEEEISRKYNKVTSFLSGKA